MISCAKKLCSQDVRRAVSSPSFKGKRQSSFATSADAPSELSAALIAHLPFRFFAVQIPVRSVVNAFDDVPVSFLAFVVELDRKVWQVRDERAAERSGGREAYELFVLRPFALGRLDRFLWTKS